MLGTSPPQIHSSSHPWGPEKLECHGTLLVSNRVSISWIFWGQTAQNTLCKHLLISGGYPTAAGAGIVFSVCSLSVAQPKEMIIFHVPSKSFCTIWCNCALPFCHPKLNLCRAMIQPPKGSQLPPFDPKWHQWQCCGGQFGQGLKWLTTWPCCRGICGIYRQCLQGCQVALKIQSHNYLFVFI